jgi:hypothetical protein
VGFDPQDNEAAREVKGSSRVEVVKSKNAAVMVLVMMVPFR